MHLIKCRNTNYRKLQKHCSLLLSLKHRDLNRQLSESIELDKFLLVDKVNFSNSKHCFQLLRSFKDHQLLPSKMFWENKTATSDSEKAEFQQLFLISLCS